MFSFAWYRLANCSGNACLSVVSFGVIVGRISIEMVGFTLESFALGDGVLPNDVHTKNIVMDV